MAHTSGPSKPKTINLALRHQCRYVIQFKIVIIPITTFSQCSRYKSPQSVSNAAYNFPGSYSATGITNLATQQTWQDCFYGFVSLVIKRLPYFLFSHFPVPRFLLPRYQRPLNTQHCIYMSLQKLDSEQFTHYDCETVHSMHIHS